jgi:hypothetical protein
VNACKTLRACPQLQAAYARSLQDLGGFLLGKEALEARASSNPALSSFMVFLDEGHLALGQDSKFIGMTRTTFGCISMPLTRLVTRFTRTPIVCLPRQMRRPSSTAGTTSRP